MPDITGLALPAFIAGVLMFLAPCTLPLVPAFLGFIGGASAERLKESTVRVRRRVLLNAILYVVGFTAVFVLFGVVFGLGGSALAAHRETVARVGGLFVIIFGLYMLGVPRPGFLRFLEAERRLNPSRYLRPGRPFSSFAFGAAFALGWSPCVGPVLGSVLLLASSSGTAIQGGILLFIFSLGMAVPFLAIAAGFAHAAGYTRAVAPHLRKINLVGGAFLLFIGMLMLTGRMAVWLGVAYKALSFIDYRRILDHL